MDRLPTEITHLILDGIALDPDISTLGTLPIYLSLGLTCRSLYYAVQPYLYRTVYLVKSDQVISNNRLLSLARYTRNIFFDVDIEASSGEETLPYLMASFPKSNEIAWTKFNQDTFLIGHHLSRSRVPDEHDIRPILTYHAFMCVLLPHCFDFLRNSMMQQLTQMTITVPRVSVHRSDTALQIEDTLRFILHNCPALKSLVISIGYSATGLGSRTGRMIRSADIREAIHRVNDDRISSEVAEHMFGQKGRDVWQDIVLCVKASWLSCIEARPSPPLLSS